MRLLKITILLLFTSPFLYGQQIPFQGRLLENGNPVTGQRNFAFSINIGAVNWSETQNNVIVTNGLYALVLGQNTPLPANLFASQNSVPLTIQVDGQSLPTTTLYAPFESDPTVPQDLKDGVSWDEVSNKPVLDESTTNEIQQLQLNSNQLSITSGNTVDLPILSDDLNIPSSLSVGTDQLISENAVEQLVSTTQSSQASIWQSFAVLERSDLTSVEIEFANVFGIDIRLKIYPGSDNSGQAIFDQIFAGSNFSSSLDFKAFSIPSITLNSGQIYTLELLGIGNIIFYNINDTNPYIIGESSLGSNTDLVFKIITERNTGFYLSSNTSGTEIQGPLEINDRIKDKTGFVIPVGSVISYAGVTPPEGWLICDGSAVPRSLFPDLFAAIGTAWGAGDGSATFNLPDLQGQFLRGVAGVSTDDPDKATRTAKYTGGNTGNNVGTYQSDEIKTHNHISIMFNNGPYVSSAGTGSLASGRFVGMPNATNLTVMSGDAGGAESRPQNAYVNFIIKY